MPLPALLLNVDLPNFTIIDVNAAYLKATNSIETDLIGKGIFEAFPENPIDKQATGVSNLSFSLHKVIRTQKIHKMDIQKYDIPLRGTNQFEERYWSPINTPIINDKNEVIHVLHTAIDVTDAEIARHKQADTEKLLQEGDIRFGSVINSTNDAITILNVNGDVISWNKGAENIFGWSASEIIGKPITLILPDQYKELYTQGMSRYNKTKQVKIIGRMIEIEGLRKNKSKLPIELSISTWNNNSQNFFCCIIRDISERKENEKRINELAAIVESADEAIISLTNEGNIFSWNKGAEKLYGYSYKEVINRHISLIVPEDLQNEEERLMTKIKNGESLNHYQTIRIRKDRSLVNISISISPIFDKQGAIIGISKLARDITEQNKIKEDLLLLNKELDAFTYSVSHDLRAPLRSIAGYAKILQEDYSDKLTEEGMRVTNVIVRNAHRMGMLIDDLLNFSRLGRQALILSKVSMQGIVEQIVNEYSENTNGVTFKINKLPIIIADNSMITQVWVNLISNAIKYSSKNSEPKIEIGSYTEKYETCFYIRDNGVGFDMKYYDKLFGVFQRLHKMNEFDGTGVGLALVKKIIEKHNGRIWAEGEVNNGAVFHFSISRH